MISKGFLKKYSFAVVYFLVCGLILFSAQPTFAACSSPAGPAGRIDYFSSSGEEVFKYCDGTDWIPWAGEPVSGAPAPLYSSSTLNDLTDVDTTGVSAGEVLLYSGGSWITGAGGGASALGDLTDVDTTGVGAGEVLLYSGGQWIPGASGGSGMGVYETKTFNADHLASADGIVIAYGQESGTNCILSGLVDASTVVVGESNNAANGDSITFPVQNGSTYRVNDNGQCTTTAMWFVSLGGGGGGGASALNDLTDVDTTGVADGDVLFYSAGAGGYVLGPVSGGSGGSGSCDNSETFTTSGLHSYTVPADFGTITIKLWGAGGGGGGSSDADGTAGGNTTISSLSLTAGGGLGGIRSSGSQNGGAGGTATGGDTNTNGNAGANGTGINGGAGANAPLGGTGGSGGFNSPGSAGSAPGGGGGGGEGPAGSGGGGSGSYVEKIYTTATLTPGTDITDINVGAGGAGGNAVFEDGGDGAHGQASISCSTAAGGSGSNGEIAFFSAGQLTSTSDLYYTSADGSVLMGGTGALTIPTGTTAQRPTAAAGMIRYSSTDDTFEGYVAGSTNDWVDLVSASSGGIGTASPTIVSGKYSTGDAFTNGGGGNNQTWDYTTGTDAPFLYDSVTGSGGVDYVEDICAIELSAISLVNATRRYTTPADQSDYYYYSINGNDWYSGIGTATVAKYVGFTIGTGWGATNCTEIEVDAYVMGSGGGASLTPATIVSAKYSTNNFLATNYTWDYSTGTDASSIDDDVTGSGGVTIASDACAVELSALSVVESINYYGTAQVGNVELSLMYSHDGLEWYLSTSHYQPASGTEIPAGFVAKYVGVGEIQGTNDTCYELDVTAYELGSGGGGSSGSPAGADREIQFNSAGSFAADTNFIYTSAGFFGIGTASPVSDLHISSTTNGNVLEIDHSTAGLMLRTAYDNSSGFSYLESDVTHFAIGVDNDSPSDWTNMLTYLTPNADDMLLVLETHTSQTQDIIQIRSQGGTDGDLLTFNSAGYLGIDTASPNALLHIGGGFHLDGTPQLIISENGADEPSVMFLDQGTDVSTIGITDDDYFAIATEDSQLGIQFKIGGAFGTDILNSATVAATFNSAGYFGIGDPTPDVALDVVGDINFTGTIIDVSDIRLKENVRKLDDPLKKLTALNGFSFEMKGGLKNGVEYGVSAQDVLQVFPELVHKLDADGTLGVNYNGLIAPMIEAMKQQQTNIEAQQSEIDKLRTQNNTLIKRLERLEQNQQQLKEQ